jgi:hypothetical protein
MNRDLDQKAVALRERRIDEALKETFPASDVPSFVGAGAPASNEPVGKPEAADVEAKIEAKSDNKSHNKNHKRK